MCDFTVLGHEFTFHVSPRLMTIDVKCKSIPKMIWRFDYNYAAIIDYMWHNPEIRLLLMRSTLL